jgi:MazG family protein
MAFWFSFHNIDYANRGCAVSDESAGQDHRPSGPPPGLDAFDGSPAGKAIDRLIAIMARLRDPAAGCPWDIEQTHETIAAYTIEEAYEVADAIAHGDDCELKQELGDLLLQSVYHARIAEERGAFVFADAANAISEKLIRRHPHVFGDAAAGTAGQAKLSWEAIKDRERAGEPKSAGALSGVPLALPALTRAVKIQEKAARTGFDWPSTDGVIDKIVEESRELAEEARNNAPAERLMEEYGDLLFVVANLARHLKIDPEAALRAAFSKFERRFRHIEARLAETGRTAHESSLEEMTVFWDEARAADKRR